MKTNAIAILSPTNVPSGGVEQVNAFMVESISAAGVPVSIISQESLPTFGFDAALRCIFGLRRAVVREFNKRAPLFAAVVCNGEYAYGVRHPRAVASFHGCYYGYARATAPYSTVRSRLALARLARIQKHGATGKYVIADSRYLASVLAEQGVRVDAVIDNAVPHRFFQAAKDRGSTNGRCLFVGAFDYFGKGFDALEALAARGVAIDCVGHTSPTTTGLNWIGPIDNNALPQVVAQYQFLLLPSRFEGGGLVAAEAMAVGVPVLMTDVGIGRDLAETIPEFVIDEVGPAFSALAIGRMETIRRNYESFSMRARAFAEVRYNEAIWRQKWLRVFSELGVKVDTV